MKNILLVEDDRKLGPTIQKGLAEKGLQTLLARTGKEAMESISGTAPDMVVLDLGLPDIDGLDLLTQIKNWRKDVPVLILTARDGITDKIAGLDAGADDYLIKPFAFSELVARIRAMLRRSDAVAYEIHVAGVCIDLVQRRVTRKEKDIALTPREFELLAFLASNKDEIVSREALAEHVWHETSRFTSLDNVIDVHVGRLKRKLADPGEHSPVEVVRGRGIMLKDRT